MSETPAKVVIGEMAVELRRLLIRWNLTQLELAERLSERTGRAFDSGAVSRWLSGSKPVTRLAASAIDELFATDAGDVFTTLRDRYVIMNDRAEGYFSTGQTLLGEVFGNPRCQADFAAQHLERRPLPIPPGYVLRYLFMSVRDCQDARTLIRRYFNEHQTESAKLVSMYDLQGHWDLAVRYVAPTECNAGMFDKHLLWYLRDEQVRGTQSSGPRSDRPDPYETFTRARGMTAQVMSRPGGGKSSFLVLNASDEYDRRRLQRAWIVVDLPDTVGRRSVVVDRLRSVVDGLPDHVRGTIESLTECDEAMIMELMLTCSNHMTVNQLNREIEEPLSRDWIQKFTLTTYAADEREWLELDV